jgi:hypothetical protein
VTPPRSSVTCAAFLLSPAFCGGRRGQLLLGGQGRFPLADRLRQGPAPIGEIFSFVSGLYFRGKLTYAHHFAGSPTQEVLIITPGWGLLPPDRMITLEELRALAAVGIGPEIPAYREPLRRDVAALDARLATGDVVVLLGSIASGKYVDVLVDLLGDRLRFPSEFVGRGDMSRGGLMLRCVLERRELSYVSLAGSSRHGPRPPRLEPLRAVKVADL